MMTKLHKAAAVALAAVSCALQAQAATQTTPVSSVISGGPIAEFMVAPVAALDNTPVHIYFSGYTTGYLRCNNEAGCGSVSVLGSVALRLTVGNNIDIDHNFDLDQQIYGPSAYGDFIDLAPRWFSSPVVTLNHDHARIAGLVASGNSQPLPGQLYVSGWQFGFSSGASNEFDITEFGAVTPRVNVHYLADPNPALDPWSASPVPEPATSAMALMGVMAVAAMVRRRASR